jgi:hypothetical protein
MWYSSRDYCNNCQHPGSKFFQWLPDVSVWRRNVGGFLRSENPSDDACLSPLSQVTTGSSAYHRQGCLTRPLLSARAPYTYRFEPSMPRVEGVHVLKDKWECRRVLEIRNKRF